MHVSALSVACHVIPASGRLVDMDIVELSESPCSGVGICCTTQHEARAADGEGIRPEPDTGTDRLNRVPYNPILFKLGPVYSVRQMKCKF